MDLQQLQANLKRINPESLAIKILKELSPEIIDLNTSQLSKGVDATGDSLPEYSSDEYYSAKRAQGIATAGRKYNLYLSGDFYSGFDVEFKGADAIIDSKDDKTGYLVALTTPDIFGLTDENMDEVRKQFIELYTFEYRNLLGL